MPHARAHATPLLLALLLAFGGAGSVRAQQVARTNLRYDEDWSVLTEQEADRSTLNRLKYLRLDADGTVHLTLGLEARARYEGFENNLWGGGRAPDDGYLWLRLMPTIDLGVGPVRVFVQPIAGYARGVGAGNGPADQTGLDLLQAFGDVRLAGGQRGSLVLRGGRQLIALGSERLVGLRYGPNIPQAFDGLRLIGQRGKLRIDLFRLRPVQVGQGNFDDLASPTRSLRGVYATAAIGGGASLDGYWLDYRNDSASFGGRTARERRQTLGLRLFGKRGRLAWNWETMVQTGHFGSDVIRAWSQATETAVSFPGLPLKPRLRLRANVASGDRRPGDGRLETFNAMFPKGKYFGELSPIGPRNLVNVHPGIDIELRRGLTVELTGAVFWRQSTGDGVYDVPGQLVRGAGASLARHVGEQAELSAVWQVTPVLSFSGSLSVFHPGAFLRETGLAKPIHMAGAEAMLKF